MFALEATHQFSQKKLVQKDLLYGSGREDINAGVLFSSEERVSRHVADDVELLGFAQQNNKATCGV